jgi:hypothetical protein
MQLELGSFTMHGYIDEMKTAVDEIIRTVFRSMQPNTMLRRIIRRRILLTKNAID